MKIKLNSLMVADQTRALQFYTAVLGFVKKTDIPMGQYSWLTVVSPEDPGGTELVLEPMAFQPAQLYQKALFEAGIPATAFEVSDIAAEHQRLENLGVIFRSKPTAMGPVTIALFEDTCGNLIQLYQHMII